MPEFSKTSLRRLHTCDIRLQTLFNAVIKRYDCSILCGHRGPKEQAQAYKSGASKLQYPKSKHNIYPSIAVDVAPYPINWDDLGAFYLFAGYVLAVADELGIKIRYGGDWNGNRKTADQTFNDLPHFELIVD